MYFMGYTACSILSSLPTLLPLMLISSLWSRRYTSDSVGELVLGGTNPDHYTDVLQYVDVSRADFWQFEMDR